MAAILRGKECKGEEEVERKKRNSLTTRVSISASIFLLMCRLVCPNDDDEHNTKFTSLFVSPLVTTTTGVAAALSYNFLTCSGRDAGVNNDVVIARFVL